MPRLSGLPDLFRRRPILLSAVAAGLVAGLLAASRLPPVTAILVGWCAAAATHLALSLRAMARSTPQSARAKAAELDADNMAALGGSLSAAVASLAAVGLNVAATPGDGMSYGSAALAIAAVVLSWTFLQVLLAHHYMHEYWLRGGGIAFPGDEPPDGVDFLYFSFTVGMTCQVSDATTSTAAMRRLVLLHGLIAFLFNAVIVAALVNVTAGLVHA